MKKIQIKLSDHYLNNSIFVDITLISILWICNTSFSWFNFKIASKSENIEILGDVVASSISLAGFILASLTVIASIRSNIANRPPEGAKNPLELFFSNENYIKIVQVFKDAIIELIAVFIISFGFWVSKENFENYTIFKLLISCIIIIFLSVARTLMVLFTIIKIPG
jgi:hypothetical protein